MLQTEVLDRLQEIVTEKIRNGDRFTAYDITRQLRAESLWVKHAHAKAEVHRLYLDGQMPGYDRALAHKGGAVPAWEYAPAGTFPASAGLLGHMLTPSASPGLLLPSGLRIYRVVRGRTVQYTPNGGMAVPVDRRSTVCIPARLVRQLALRPGDTVRVLIDRLEARLIVRPAEDDDAPIGLPARRYTVDRHANIRITGMPQRRAGLDGPRREIRPHGHELIITAV
jgi:bifunctional DNA-binding transcriptional regulator/antitoxin component of YhaV-PrlF toxin-antitoxin module